MITFYGTNNDGGDQHRRQLVCFQLSKKVLLKRFELDGFEFYEGVKDTLVKCSFVLFFQSFLPIKEMSIQFPPSILHISFNHIGVIAFGGVGIPFYRTVWWDIGELENAHNVFDEIPESSLVSWMRSHVMSTWVNMNFGLSLFYGPCQSSMHPGGTYIILVKLCAHVSHF